MDIRIDIIKKNLGTWANAYGLDASSRKLSEDLLNGHGFVKSVGVLLRDPDTKKGLICCEFPVHGDYASQMLWVPISERPVEAVPIYTREKEGAYLRLKNAWKTIAERVSEDRYHLIEEGEIKLKVHQSFCKLGVIDHYSLAEAIGHIRRNRKGIFFMKKWCHLAEIVVGKEVSFVPIISQRGLQARAIEEIPV